VVHYFLQRLKLRKRRLKKFSLRLTIIFGEKLRRRQKRFEIRHCLQVKKSRNEINKDLSQFSVANASEQAISKQGERSDRNRSSKTSSKRRFYQQMSFLLSSLQKNSARKEKQRRVFFFESHLTNSISGICYNSECGREFCGSCRRQHAAGDFCSVSKKSVRKLFSSPDVKIKTTIRRL
jgi:hypothetical protein